MTISADWEAGRTVLETMRLLRERFPRVNTYAGLSNIGYGMPGRALLNQTMVAMMLALGLEAFMVDTRNAQVMATLCAGAALSGQDEWCRNYMKAFRTGKLG
jgi:5-methyltetrahydrofolate--homocysteine methyltransferase